MPPTQHTFPGGLCHFDPLPTQLDSIKSRCVLFVSFVFVFFLLFFILTQYEQVVATQRQSASVSLWCNSARDYLSSSIKKEQGKLAFKVARCFGERRDVPAYRKEPPDCFFFGLFVSSFICSDLSICFGYRWLLDWWKGEWGIPPPQIPICKLPPPNGL